jgi:two-component system, LytTR family, sensor kinase
MRPWMLVSAAWIAPAILGCVNEIAQNLMSREPHVDVKAVLFAGFDWLLYAFLTPAVFAISARWPLSRSHLRTRVPLHLAISLIFCVAWAGSGTLLKAALMPQALWGGVAENFVRWLFITLPFGVAVYLAVVGTEHAIRYFVEARERAEQLSQARFAALQAEVNPHFLFNTLNTVGVLVRDGERTAATRIVEQLSDVLRRTLSSHRTNEVRLDEELELVRQYLGIEQARFSDRLRPRFEIDDALLSAAVPSFALQQLVENAVRHGIAKSPDAGLVIVRARRDGDTLELMVIDDGAGFDASVRAAGHGIENTRERLRALYGDRASLTIARGADGGTIATLRVPYRTLTLEAGIAER